MCIKKKCILRGDRQLVYIRIFLIFQMLFIYLLTNICKQYLPFHLIHLKNLCLIFNHNLNSFNFRIVANLALVAFL